MKKKVCTLVYSIIISIFLAVVTYAGVSFNMYVTNHDSDSDYYEYEMFYDNSDSYNKFLNWMKVNNELVSEFIDEKNHYFMYSFKAPDKLQGWDEAGKKETRDIEFRFEVYQNEEGYRVTSTFPEIFFIANKIENNNLENMNWKDYGDNSYSIE